MVWECFALVPAKEENTLCLLLLPNIFSRDPSESSERDRLGEKGSESTEPESLSSHSSTFFLPLLLLHCEQDILLDPDPATPSPPSLLPDIFQQFPLSLSPSPTPSRAPPSSSAHPPTTTPSPQASIDKSEKPTDTLEHFHSSLANVALVQLVLKLRALHFSSYLYALHATLSQKIPVPSGGFGAAVDICSRSTLSLDCTPLVGALCRHSQLQQSPVSAGADGTDGSLNGRGINFGANVFSELIKTVLSPDSSRSASHRLRYVEQPEETLGEGDEHQVPHCLRWEGELQLMFQKYLSGAGFESVPNCEGYFWLRGEDELTDSLWKGKRYDGSGEEEEDERGADGDGRPSPPSDTTTVVRNQSFRFDNTTLQAGSPSGTMCT